jgi:hypothetical protein
LRRRRERSYVIFAPDIGIQVASADMLLNGTALPAPLSPPASVRQTGLDASEVTVAGSSAMTVRRQRPDGRER